MWGIIPAAGAGSRIQPLAFSKELLPVGSRFDGETEHPRAVSEYLIERMILGGAKKICFVISSGKSDILNYFGGEILGADIAYVVQPKPAGLCDALFRALPLIDPGEQVLIGLPDTIWFPENGFCELPDDVLSFLLFPVEQPQFFDAVVADDMGNVREIQVKQPRPDSSLVWGAFKMSGRILRELYQLWRDPSRGDEYMGTLVNGYLARGGKARAVNAGESYVDVGTLNGYREATRLLTRVGRVAPRAPLRKTGTRRAKSVTPSKLSSASSPPSDEGEGGNIVTPVALGQPRSDAPHLHEVRSKRLHRPAAISSSSREGDT